MQKSRVIGFTFDYLFICIAMFLAALFLPFDRVGFEPASTAGRIVTSSVGLLLVYAVYWRHFVSHRNT